MRVGPEGDGERWERAGVRVGPEGDVERWDGMGWDWMGLG